MDRQVALKALVVQVLSVVVISIALGVALPHSFFEDWGWLTGPTAWIVCAALTARVLALPIVGVLIGAVLAGLPAALAVVLGLHWLGALVACALFALWCGRLAVDGRSSVRPVG